MSTEYVGPEDRGRAVFAVTTATLALATTFVAARLVCRKFIVRNISWDDRIMILAWVIAFGLSFTIDFGTHKGLGKHDRDIPERDWAPLQRCQYVFSVLYVSGGHRTLGIVRSCRGLSNTRRIPPSWRRKPAS